MLGTVARPRVQRERLTQAFGWDRRICVRVRDSIVSAYLTGKTLTVGGLAEFTTYLFQVYAGDESGFDVNFFTPLPSVQTLIIRT